jgi:DNA topoisomerase-1
MYGGNKNQWTLLKHNGPLFPLPYEPHKVPIIVNNNKIILPELAEEYATMFAKYLDTDYINNKIFLKNFWSEFKKVLPKDLNINKLEDIDFIPIKNYLLTLKEQKNELTKSQKEINKKIQDDYEEPYKYCIIDGVQQHVGNYKIEPPGIFLGRGNHPKSGLIKKRIYPEDVTINISKDCPVPKPNLSNHNWGNIVNDQNVIWLATWKDEITNKNKYIFTSFDSFFKSKSDEHKFDLARQLKKKINKIREEYKNQLFDTNNKNIKGITTNIFSPSIIFSNKLFCSVRSRKTNIKIKNRKQKFPIKLLNSKLFLVSNLIRMLEK